MRHILLIDSDEDELLIFEVAIKNTNIDCICHYAEDCETATALLKTIKPDVIFIEFVMTKADCLDYLDHLRASGITETVPLFVYSSCISESSKEKALLKGATGCIEKFKQIADISRLLEQIFATDNLTKEIVL